MIRTAIAFALLFQAPVAVVNPANPPGFAGPDRFTDMNTACATIAHELAPEFEGVAYLWCQYRARHSVRGTTYASRVDGSMIHDMDRPAAWAMYKWGVRVGRINPGGCPHDRYDANIKHPKKERKLAANWPFQFVHMDEAKAKSWMRRPYDVERFGTRGWIDNNVTVARSVMPGCWSPEALDRRDMGATVTVLRAKAICTKYVTKHPKRKCKHSTIRSEW